MTLSTLLVLKSALLLCLLAVLTLTLARMRSAKQVQDRLIDGLDPASRAGWFRVNVTRPAAFARTWKFLGFEARGVLVNAADSIRVLAELPSGERIDRTWRKPVPGLAWVGNRGLGSANLHWLSLGGGEGALLVTSDTGVNALNSREATADMCRMIAPDFRLPEVARREFALEKEPATLMAVVLMLATLVYAIVDGVMLNRHELIDAGWALYGLPAAMLLALPFWAWQSARAVPAREAVAVSTLLAVALAFAYVPALKRVDQALAGGARIHAYRLGPGAMLTPVRPGPPVIDASRHERYWAQFKPGSVHDLPLVHGPLGLWQLDKRGLEADLKAFYQAHPGPRRGR
jgi:hypothetical protein